MASSSRDCLPFGPPGGSKIIAPIPPFGVECYCCEKNLQSLRFQKELEAVGTADPVHNDLHKFRIWSHAGLMACADCENVKTRISSLPGSFRIDKDKLGYIIMVTNKRCAFHLLKLTAVFRAIYPNGAPA